MKNSVYDLRVNDMENPMGICETPLFSWKTKAFRRGAKQSAYRIVVASDIGFFNIVWETGKIISDKSLSVMYEGKNIKPQTKYFWCVNLWDENDEKYCSEISSFETGLMGDYESQWKGAKWIGAPYKALNTGDLMHYKISFDFVTDNGFSFVVNARNKDRYVEINIDTASMKVKVTEHSDNAWSGSLKDGVRPYKNVLAKGKIPFLNNGKNKLTLEVAKSKLTLYINEALVMDDDILPVAKDHHPYKQRLFLAGFINGSDTKISNLLLTKTDSDEEVLVNEDFSDTNTRFSRLGEINNNVLKLNKGFNLFNFFPSGVVSKSIVLTKKVHKARLYASARGAYDLYINGNKVNESFFNPGFTDYRKRIQYQTYDITPFLKKNRNVFGAMLANGYYSGFLGYNVAPMVYGTQPSFICRIDIEYSNGEKETFVSDESWFFNDNTPVLYDDYLNGEIYDARYDVDWSIPDEELKKCGIIAPPKAPVATNGSFDTKEKFELSPQSGPTATVKCEIEAKFLNETKKGHFVYDLGQNIVGTVRVRVQGDAGASIKIRYGEMCYKSGEIYLRNLRTALNTDVYTLKGCKCGEEFIPSFTYHGFRYIEISGHGEKLKSKNIVLSISGLAITNTVKESGYFECSDENVNKLYSNIMWGQIDNSLLIYTDCPQRNERMGWTGDAQVFARTAAYNMDIKAFMNKWLLDMRDAQLMYNKDGAVPDTAPLGGDNRKDGCAGWADAAVIVPWEMYRATGDIKILKANYEMMCDWIKYQNRSDRKNYGLRIVDGQEMPEESDLASIPFIQTQQRRGDHLTFDESTPFILSATAYAAYVTELMVKISEILGKHDDKSVFSEIHKNIKRAFNEAWVKDDGDIAYWGEMSKDKINKIYYSEASENKPSQTAYVLALAFNLVPEEKAEKTAKFLADAIKRNNNRLTTGFLGVSHLNPTLTRYGYNDLAYSLLLQDENPSWLYSVKNGATTIWERWDSYIAESDTFGDVSMNSFNHYAYGALGEWMMETVLGIVPALPGYKHIYIRPQINKALMYASGSHISPYGEIKSSWERCKDSTIIKCTIPPNTTATVFLGEKYAEIGSGSYEFEI